MITPDIVCFIEHVARELDIAAALKYLLKSKYGLSCRIVSLYVENDLMCVLKMAPARLVAVPYCTSCDDWRLRDILHAWPTSIYVNLCYEQALNELNKKLKAPKDVFAKRHVLHHAWGEFFSQYLQKHGVPEESIFKNGNPTYMLYREPYRRFYESREELASRHGLDLDKRWVFIPENYRAAFLAGAKIQRYLSHGCKESDVVTYRDFARSSFAECARWWRRAAETGEAELILRPRPSTPKAQFVNEYRRAAEEIPAHLRIIKDGTVREWILASDLVVSSYSTALLEAAVAEKSVYILLPYRFPPVVQAEWRDWVEKLESLDAFLNAVTASCLARNWVTAKAGVERTMICHEDAIANLADVLAGLCTGKRRSPVPPLQGGFSARSSARGIACFGRLAEFARGIVGRILGRRKVPVFRKEDAFTDAEVAYRVEKWSNLLA